MLRYAFFALVPVIFALDRVTKALVIQNMPMMSEMKVTSFFSIVHVRNFGGVFGVLNQSGYAKYIFTIVPVLVAAALIYILIRYAMRSAKTLALCLILSGALGNIYDRIVYGSVVDFLDFYYGKCHWPAFNVADIAVSTGIGLIILFELTETTGKGPAR
ncbi:MAG: signal peptidase II [Syntrophorhabdaceae bacterium]|nr:signal peptidase II [Syntrophorhabdaceae bacterium]